MAQTYNKVTLIGNIGKNDASHKTVGTGVVTNFTLATSEPVKDKDGNWTDDVTWHTIAAWNLTDYQKNGLLAGTRVFVEGKIRKRSYKDSNNIDRVSFEIIAEKLILLADKSNASSEPREPRATLVVPPVVQHLTNAIPDDTDMFDQ